VKHQEALANVMIGIVANEGSLGATANDIELKLPVMALNHAREEMRLEGHYLNFSILQLMLGKLVREGVLTTHATGGVSRYVVVVPDARLNVEVNNLKERIAHLERLISPQRG
jgi:hypothetical protein